MNFERPLSPSAIDPTQIYNESRSGSSRYLGYYLHRSGQWQLAIRNAIRIQVPSLAIYDKAVGNYYSMGAKRISWKEVADRRSAMGEREACQHILSPKGDELERIYCKYLSVSVYIVNYPRHSQNACSARSFTGWEGVQYIWSVDETTMTVSGQWLNRLMFHWRVPLSVTKRKPAIWLLKLDGSLVGLTIKRVCISKSLHRLYHLSRLLSPLLSFSSTNGVSPHTPTSSKASSKYDDL